MPYLFSTISGICTGSSALWRWSYCVPQLGRIVCGLLAKRTCGRHDSIRSAPEVSRYERADAGNDVGTGSVTCDSAQKDRPWEHSVSDSENKSNLAPLPPPLFRRPVCCNWSSQGTGVVIVHNADTTMYYLSTLNHQGTFIIASTLALPSLFPAF
jgi:hypothetical protein